MFVKATIFSLLLYLHETCKIEDVYIGLCSLYQEIASLIVECIFFMKFFFLEDYNYNYLERFRQRIAPQMLFFENK